MRSAILALLALAGTTAARAEFVVAPGGSDTNPGTRARPLASLERALELAAAGSDKRILVRNGTYRLRRGLLLEARHTGISIEGEPGATLAGSVAVPATVLESVSPELRARLPEATRAHARQIRLARLGLGGADFLRPRGFTVASDGPCELFSGDEAQRLAQWPNEGMARIARVLEGGDVPREEKLEGRKPVVVVDSTRPGAWGPGDLWAYGYWRWDWADESLPVQRIEGATVHLGGPHHYGVVAGQPVRFENVLEELDVPGEAATAGDRLVFWPSTDAPLEISTLGEPLLSLAGAHDVLVRGLAFERSRGVGIEIRGGGRIRIERCAFRNLALNALTSVGAERVVLRGCLVEDTGEGGFFLEGGDRATLAPSEILVEECAFRRFMRRARTYRPAVRLAGVGIAVRHCDFRDAPHSAILFSGNDHLVERCRFSDLLSDTGDGGAVYGGRDWTARGTVIRENLFARIRGMRKWENAVYLDDQLSGIIVERNVFVECHWAMLIGGGRENVVRDNLLLGCTLGFSTDARGLGWAASTLAILKERLEAVPVGEQPWRGRFPDLATVLEDQPMAPMRNVVERNVLVRSGSMGDRLDPTFARLGTVRDNPSWTDTGWRLTSRGFRLSEALRQKLADLSAIQSLEGLEFGFDSAATELDPWWELGGGSPYRPADHPPPMP